MPHEERPDDPQPPDDRDRPHTRHLPGHLRPRVHAGEDGGRRVAATAASTAVSAVLLVVLVLAPRVRLAYLALPVNLLLWSRLLRDDRSRQSPRSEAGRRWRWPLAAFAQADTALPFRSFGAVASVNAPGEIERSSPGRTGNETVPSALVRGE